MTDGPEHEGYQLATSVSHLLHRAEQLASERFTQLVGDAISLRAFSVLAAIHERPGLSQSDLVKITGIDRSTLADMMNRMEKRGWVARTQSLSDKRAFSVRLAASGAQIMAGATHHARASDAAILDLLPRTKRKTFLNILAKLAKLSEEVSAKAERDAKRQAKREARERRQRGRAKPKPGKRA